MRFLERHPIDRLPKIERSEERDTKLSMFLTTEIEDALTARRTWDRVVNEARRQYNGIPKRPMREVPVPNAPNVEIPLGAILADDIYAQAVDTLFTASPLLTVRPVDDKWVEHAKAAQDWVNWLVGNELDLRNAVNSAFVDDCQLGTAVYYIPFVEFTKKDRVYRVTYRSPRIFAVSPEDWLVPPGSRADVQADRWVALRFWYTKGELEERARERGWDIEGVSPIAQFDIVRLQHERKGNVSPASLWREVYEILEVYVYFDYDGDGLDEDLLVTFDRTSRKILNVTFNPYDLRPIEVMRYQLRSALPYGIGIMEMVQPFQEETTELHNYTTLNIFLANARVWAIREGSYPHDTVDITPGRTIKLNAEDVNTAIRELKMSEVYPSAFQAQSSAIALAERRVGTSGSAGILAKGGSRTPGVTALSLLQQVNRRFAPAFDDMREATARAVKQALYRYRERLLARDKQVQDHITSVLGADRAFLIVELLTTDDFEKSVAVEFTASTASVNREADRQAALMVAQMMQQYYNQTVALALQASTQPMPQELRDMMVDIAKKGTELMDRVLRTFDTVRDPKNLLIDLSKLEQTMEAAGVAQDRMAQAQVLTHLAGLAGNGQAPQPPNFGQPLSPEELQGLHAPPAPGIASSGQQ